MNFKNKQWYYVSVMNAKEMVFYFSEFHLTDILEVLGHEMWLIYKEIIYCSQVFNHFIKVNLK